MKALVVGFGSIGQRHARLLQQLGCETAVVSGRNGVHPQCFPTLRAALTAWRPEYIVIANETGAHFDSLRTLCEAGYAGRVLVEKPLFDRSLTDLEMPFSHAAVAYNFRFHPLVLRLRQDLAEVRIFDAALHVGQWLPDWRPDRDYRSSYSAKRDAGGGVLRDLSHELDLGLHFFGAWSQLSAIGGHFSELEIDSDDAYTLALAMERCPSVSISLNYLDRPARRYAVVNTSRGCFHLDMIKGILALDGAVIAEQTVARDDTYRAQHQAMIEGRMNDLCSIDEGISVLRMIEAAEVANNDRRWISA